jgi:hypothetical protein
MSGDAISRHRDGAPGFVMLYFQFSDWRIDIWQNSLPQARIGKTVAMQVH